jgi:soluble lytic murein transglycosylase-like protein
MRILLHIFVGLALAAFAFAADSAPPRATPATRTIRTAVLRNGFSIQHDRSEQRDDKTRLWMGDGYVDVATDDIDHFEEEQAPELAPEVKAANAVAADKPQFSIPEIVHRTSTRFQLDPDFVASVIRAESEFNPHAISRKGARGLMQLMPQTAAQLGVKNAFDPQSNVEAGTRYLRDLLVQYHGDAQKALAAYNAGPEPVQRYGGVPPYRETRAYVTRIINDYNRTKRAQEQKQEQKPEQKKDTKTASP